MASAGALQPSLAAVDGDIHRSGGTNGISIDLLGIDLAIARAAARAGVGPGAGDVHVATLSAGGYIFWSIPYLPYPVMFGRSWMHLEGNVTAAGGGAR